jgi:hypothetical protein
LLRPGEASLFCEIIGQAGYLSMNAAAWQPSRTAPERARPFEIESACISNGDIGPIQRESR